MSELPWLACAVPNAPSRRHYWSPLSSYARRFLEPWKIPSRDTPSNATRRCFCSPVGFSISRRRKVRFGVEAGLISRQLCSLVGIERILGEAALQRCAKVWFLGRGLALPHYFSGESVMRNRVRTCS